MNMFSFSGSNVVCPDNVRKHVSLDILWAFLLNILLKAQMWTGWNSLRHEERILQQKVGNMKPSTFPSNLQ